MIQLRRSNERNFKDDADVSIASREIIVEKACYLEIIQTIVKSFKFNIDFWLDDIVDIKNDIISVERKYLDKNDFELK